MKIKLHPAFKRSAPSTGSDACIFSNDLRPARFYIRGEPIGIISHNKVNLIEARKESAPVWTVRVLCPGSDNRVAWRIYGSDFNEAKRVVRGRISQIYAVYALMNPFSCLYRDSIGPEGESHLEKMRVFVEIGTMCGSRAWVFCQDGSREGLQQGDKVIFKEKFYDPWKYGIIDGVVDILQSKMYKICLM